MEARKKISAPPRRAETSVVPPRGTFAASRRAETSAPPRRVTVAAPSRSSTEEDVGESYEEDVGIKELKLTLKDANPMDYLMFKPESIRTIAAKINKEGKPKKLGSMSPWPIQNVAGKTLAKLSGICQFKAPTGFGKTITTVIAALKATRCIICIPPKIYGVWTGALRKLELYHSNPTLSTFYDYSVNGKHIDFLEAVKKDPRRYVGTNKKLVILCKRSSLKYAVDLFAATGWGDNSTIIVDEAHMDQKDVASYVLPIVQSGEITRLILMSGTDIDFKKLGMTQRGMVVNNFLWTTITDKVPDDIWHYEMMDEPYFVYNDEGDRSISQSWKRIIDGILRRYTKVAIVGTLEAKASLFGDVKGQAMKTYKGKNIVRFTSNASTIEDRFNKKGVDTIAALDYRSSTGINLLGDCMIVINPGTMSNDALIQLAARLKRPNNKRKEVHYYMLCGNIGELLKSYYAWAFYHHAWTFGHDIDVNVGMVGKGFAMIKALGMSPIELDRTDACVILADYTKRSTSDAVTLDQLSAEPFDQIYAWWLKNKSPTTVLTEDLIRDIVW